MTFQVTVNASHIWATLSLPIMIYLVFSWCTRNFSTDKEAIWDTPIIISAMGMSIGWIYSATQIRTIENSTLVQATDFVASMRLEIVQKSQ